MDRPSSPTQDDYRRLESPDHWLGWLPGPSPGQAIRQALQETLAEQVPGSHIDWLQVVDEPVHLTAVVRSPENEERMIVRRAAVATPFVLAVTSPGAQSENLTGVFSWAAGSLDTPWKRCDRTWLDLHWTRDQAAQALDHRIYEVA